MDKKLGVSTFWYLKKLETYAPTKTYAQKLIGILFTIAKLGISKDVLQ